MLFVSAAHAPFACTLGDASLLVVQCWWPMIVCLLVATLVANDRLSVGGNFAGALPGMFGLLLH